MIVLWPQGFDRDQNRGFPGKIGMLRFPRLRDAWPHTTHWNRSMPSWLFSVALKVWARKVPELPSAALGIGLSHAHPGDETPERLGAAPTVKTCGPTLPRPPPRARRAGVDSPAAAPDAATLRGLWANAQARRPRAISTPHGIGLKECVRRIPAIDDGHPRHET